MMINDDFHNSNDYFFSQSIMMKGPRIEWDKGIVDNIIKGVRNLFRIKNRRHGNQKCKKYFWTEKNNEAIKDKVIKDIRNHFKYEEGYCKSVREVKLWSNNYRSNCDRNKTLLIEEYL